MNVTIKIACDNAAFGDAPEVEVARILHDLARKIEAQGLNSIEKLRDGNGNTVGSLKVTGKAK
jgi:hypothetical protein